MLLKRKKMDSSPTSYVSAYFTFVLNNGLPPSLPMDRLVYIRNCFHNNPDEYQTPETLEDLKEFTEVLFFPPPPVGPEGERRKGVWLVMSGLYLESNPQDLDEVLTLGIEYWVRRRRRRSVLERCLSRILSFLFYPFSQ